MGSGGDLRNSRIPSVNIGRTYGVQKHSLEEEADIEGLFTAQKQLVLLLASLR